MHSRRRAQVYIELGGVCGYCGCALRSDFELALAAEAIGAHRFSLMREPDAMEIDHMMPRARGGRDALENLRSSCGPCNRSKGKKTLLEFFGISR